MRMRVLAVAGVLVTVAGLVWTLQGLGYLKGSVMTGSTFWAVAGPLVATLGLVMVVTGLRARRR